MEQHWHGYLIDLVSEHADKWRIRHINVYVYTCSICCVLSNNCTDKCCSKLSKFHRYYDKAAKKSRMLVETSSYATDKSIIDRSMTISSSNGSSRSICSRHASLKSLDEMSAICCQIPHYLWRQRISLSRRSGALALVLCTILQKLFRHNSIRFTTVCWVCI